LGRLTIITGVSTLLDATGNMTGVHILSEIGLNLYILLGIIWPVVIGISLIRKTVSNPSINIVNPRTAAQAVPYEKA
jgi:hypothetical protein